MSEIVVRDIQWGTKEYEDELALRNEILRVPLGLNLYKQDLSQENTYWHVGAFDGGRLVGTLLFTLLPWVMVLAWAWLGMDCGRQRRPFWLSLLAGHWGVLLSVLCGAWQFWLVDDAARSIPIALFGQFISGVVPGAMMLVTPLCIVDGTYMGSLLVVWGGIASAVLLILIFTVSYWVGRRIAKAP